MGSRTSSSDLDNMRGIPQLLRTRMSGAVGTQLPELGALLGRGSFGKVYKGTPAHILPILSRMPPCMPVRCSNIHSAIAF